MEICRVFFFTIACFCFQMLHVPGTSRFRLVLLKTKNWSWHQDHQMAHIYWLFHCCLGILSRPERVCNWTSVVLEPCFEQALCSCSGVLRVTTRMSRIYFCCRVGYVKLLFRKVSIRAVLYLIAHHKRLFILLEKGTLTLFLREMKVFLLEKKEANVSKIGILTNCRRDSALVRSSVRWFTLCFTSVTIWRLLCYDYCNKKNEKLSSKFVSLP